MIPNHRKRLPLEAPLMRVVASAGIIGTAVAVAAIMGSRDSQGDPRPVGGWRVEREGAEHPLSEHNSEAQP
jgi:hypothetical protein